MVEFGVVLLSLCIAISVIVFAARLHVRYKASNLTIQELPLGLALSFLIGLAGVQYKLYQLLASPPTPEVQGAIGMTFFIGTFFYISGLWAVKISVNILHIQLTRKIPHVHRWAVWSLYVLFLTYVIIIVTYIAACQPYRWWDGPTGKAKPCPPILKQWYFWLHVSIHLTTDIWLCLLPFPALRLITERRLYIAVAGVYSLTLISIASSITRIIILATDTSAGVKKIQIFTFIESFTIFIVGCLPGFSTLFISKYVNGSGNRSAKRNQDSSFVPIDDKTSHETRNSIYLADVGKKNVNGSTSNYDDSSSTKAMIESMDQIRKITQIQVNSVDYKV